MHSICKKSSHGIPLDVKLKACFLELMNEALDRELHDNLKFKHRKFSYGYEDVESVYLTEDEIRKLYKFDFSDDKKHDKKQDQVRDLFVIGCVTRLRFGDYSTLKPENIRGKLIEIFSTEKTGEQITVPLHEYVEDFYKKYNGFPKKMTVQKFNEYLKQVCEKAGLTETGRPQSDPKIPLHNLVSSHTARRSFCTNHYLSGFPAIDLMKISGHRTERAFLKYVKVSKQKVAERLQAHIDMRKMKVV